MSKFRIDGGESEENPVLMCIKGEEEAILATASKFRKLTLKKDGTVCK